MKLIFPAWKECQTPGHVGLLCHHVNNKQYWTCWFLQCCFFFCRKEIGMHYDKYAWPLRHSCRILCSSHFWVLKKLCPQPHFHQLTPSNKWHATSAPLFKLPVNFHILRWCHEGSRSPEFRITFVWKTSEVSCYYSFFVYLQKLWNLTLVVILCKLNTWPQLSRFVYMNAIAFKCIFSPYEQKSVS